MYPICRGDIELETSVQEGGGVPYRRDVLDLMHGLSRMTIDPRIPTVPGRSMSGFHRLGRHRSHEARSAVSCPSSRMKGELHPIENRLRGGRANG